MCGITGYLSRHDMDGRAMSRSLRHRGPDNLGKYNVDVNGFRVFLGHCRLSIIDLSSSAHQPMVSADGNTILILNGEIYNFKELKERYLKDRTFRSNSDTEVLLHLFEWQGIDCLRMLNGDFALAVLDRRREKLFLARDRLGVKPLYYLEQSDGLLFASEIKAFAAAGVNLELAESLLQRYFVFKYMPGNDTLFRSVRRLPPASWLEFDLRTGATKIEKYWTLRKNPVYDNLSFVEAESVLFDLLRDAATIRLVADVPVGNFLSGGSDSSILAYFLKDKHDISHYCARKTRLDLRREGTTSDFFHAAKLSKEWNLNLVPIDISSAEANRELIRHTLYFADDLIADGSQIPSYLITREAGKTSKVILSGMGADELFFGYASHQLILLARLLDRLPRFFSRMLAGVSRSLSQGRGGLLAYRRYLHKFGKYYGYPHYKYGLYSIVGDFANAVSICRGDSEATVEFLRGYFREGEDIFDALMRFEIDNFLVKNLHYMDRMSMANSVENRVPYLDHRLVEFAYSLPWRYKITRLGRGKRLLKDTFRKVLPQHIRVRRKAGFGMPLRSILASPAKLGELLDKRFIESFPGLSSPDIEMVKSSHLSGREDNSALIYALISFQEWHKMFVSGEVAT